MRDHDSPLAIGEPHSTSALSIVEVAQLATALSVAPDLQAIYQLVQQEIPALTGAAAARLALPGPGHEPLSPASAEGSSTGPERIPWPAIEHREFEAAARAGSSLLVPCPGTSLPTGTEDAASTRNAPHFLVLPCQVGTRAECALFLRYDSAPPLAEAGKAALTIIGLQCALAVQRLGSTPQEPGHRSGQDELVMPLTRQAEGQREPWEFQQLLELNPDAVMIRQGSRVVYANKALATMLKAASPADLIGRPTFFAIHPEFRALAELRASRAALGMGPNPPSTVRVVCEDGSVADVETVSAACVWSGAPAIQVIFRDLSERQEAARNLEESERRFRFLVESIPHFVWSAGADGSLDYFSPQLLDYLGVPSSHLGGAKWPAVLHPDDSEPAAAAWRAAVSAETEYQFEFRLRHGVDGRYRWFRAHALPFRSDTRAVVRWYGTCTDIDESKKLYQQVYATQERLAAALDAGGMAVWQLDAATGRIEIEGGFEQMLGVAVGQFDGTLHSIEQYVAREDQGRIREAIGLSDSELDRGSMEFRVVWPDGSTHWVEAEGVTARDADGRPVRVTGTLRNIDERLRAAAKLEKRSENLRLLGDVAAYFLEHERLDQDLHGVLELVAHRLDADVFYSFLRSAPTEPLRLAYLGGLEGAGRARLESLRFEETIAGTTAAKGTPILINHVQDSKDPTLWRLQDDGLRAYVCHPMMVGGRLVGTLAFGSRTRESFTSDEVAVLDTISQYMAIAHERTQLLNELHRRASQFSHLIDAQRRIAQAEPHLNTRLQILMRSAQELIRASGAAVGQVDGEWIQYSAACGTLVECIGRRLPRAGSLVGKAVREAVPQFCADSEADPDIDLAISRQMGVRSFIVLPLIYNRVVVGVLTVASTAPDAFSADDQTLAEVMASIVVAAMSAVTVAETRLALSTAEDYLRLAVEGAGIGVWSWDARIEQVTWSSEMYAINGIQPGTPVTRAAAWAAIHPDDRSRAEREMTRALFAGTPYESEHRVVRPDGSERWVSERGHTVLGDDGSPIRHEGVTIDITDQRRLQAQLVQSQKMEGIGQLAGGIAHDFNNLLSVILGYAELIEGDMESSDPSAESLHNIQTAANRAAKLTKQLLAFARRQVTDLSVFPINTLLESTTQLLAPLIGENIVVNLRLSPDPCRIRADRNQIEQVIMNLIVNARDVMPDGGRLTIRTEIVAVLSATVIEDVTIQSGSYVLIAVGDTGSGITPEVKAHVFEPFYTTKAPGHGTGLGLATCYGIVKQHRGYIIIESGVGQGTVVNVYLPCESALTPEEAEQSPVRPADGVETLLVAEDEDLLRQLAVRTLRARGYVVLEASDGAEALQVAEEHEGPIDLLVTDMVMMNMGGYELAKRLQAARPETRVLFVSGYSEQVFNPQGTIPVAAPLLQKPFTSHKLLETIRQILDG